MKEPSFMNYMTNTQMRLERCVNNVMPNATFKKHLHILHTCIWTLNTNVEFHCLENCTSFGRVYGPEGFYGKGKTICYTIHIF